jgi:hypothetical protein
MTHTPAAVMAVNRSGREMPGEELHRFGKIEKHEYG